MASDVSYRLMRSGEEREVCALVARVFDRFVAPDFLPTGVEEFYRYAEPNALAERREAGHTVLVAEEGSGVVGMLELRGLDHIAMLFVEGQGRGIGKELVARAVQLCSEHAPQVRGISVHASRYAVPVYRKMGFQAVGEERTENGITYLPMVLRTRTGG